jgi:hypothetical protein
MNLAPLLCVVRVTERHLLLLIRGLLVVVSTVSVISTILAISSVYHVYFPIVLLLLRRPLAMRLKKLSLSFRSLDACVRECEQIAHHPGLLHSNLLHSLDVADSVTEGVNDLDVLDIWDSIPNIAETFYSLESISSIWMLICALEVSDEHDT